MKNLKVYFLALLLLCLSKVHGQTLTAQMAATVKEIWPNSPASWSYDYGVVSEGFTMLWKHTGDTSYFNYIRKGMDSHLLQEGVISGYQPQTFNIDFIKNGRILLTLYKATGDEKYLKASTLLWDQLKNHPRTKEGGFWHKKVYPYQMWLDGLYMGEPFYTEYALMVKETKAFDDIANQFIFMENHAREPKTGLLYHGWDESKEQKWANKETGTSPHFWGRAMGWYAMGLVDVLEIFPKDHPKRKDLVAILNRTMTAVQKVQDPKSGLWYDILDKPDGKGNYFESSAACMFVYAAAKGVRLGLLPKQSFAIAQKGFEGIKKEFVEQRTPGKINLKGTVSVSGLGGSPYRDGSYEYYMSEKVITNDMKGVGAFLLASGEMDLASGKK